MILNSGLDNFGVRPAGSTYSGGPFFNDWVNFAAIGTGTTAPAVTQTALVAETHRTSDRGGFTETDSTMRDAVANVIRYTANMVRVFNFTASFNLTEYGYSPFSTAGGGNLSFRELFRAIPTDPASAPVVITVVSGDQLQLRYQLIITVPWLTASQTFTITGAGTFIGAATFFATSDVNALEAMRDVFAPAPDATPRLRFVRQGDAAPTLRDASVAARADNLPANVPVIVNDAYVIGSYLRVKRGTFTTAGGNHTHIAWLLTGDLTVGSGATHTVSHGYKFVLTTPATFTKASTHIFRLDFESTWMRG